MVLPLRTRSDGSALRRSSSSGKGRNLLRSLKCRTSSLSKRNVTFSEKLDQYEDYNGDNHQLNEEEAVLVLKKRHPWNEEDDLKMLSSFQVTHFRTFTEVKQQKSLFDDDSDFTGPLPPPSPKISPTAPKKKVEDYVPLPKLVKVAVCETSTTGTASSTACSSSSSSLFDDKTNIEDVGETLVVGLEVERNRKEAKLIQEMFHDLTCRCFTPASCG